MNNKDFNELLECTLQNSKNVLGSKSVEYSTENDKLHNFKKAGRLIDQHPALALRGMKLKHDVSIDDLIIKLSSGIIPSKEIVDEKIGDDINYLILLKVIFYEEINKKQKNIDTNSNV